ncbi:TOBE domain-containing protein [Leeia sp. TBRC 13508]|uniref:TOBE domain-containing protein n=1 Tax=Leeia speluncae TaxID=2884804 RepID=A0ABS8D4U5_9NEIS|nr:TOBE domain-containing protein [Leeia speluncae]MCB6183147.1 TOBE domain-containing protein [Leeia speluncae]
MAEHSSFTVESELSLSINGQLLGGKNRIALLSAIAAEGSISKAAKRIGLSYKGAWDAVDTMNNLVGEQLVEKMTGGKGGGGTRLTPRGELLVLQYEQLCHAQKAFLNQFNTENNATTLPVNLFQQLNLKTSARNQFVGTVEQIQKGAVNDEITILLAGNQPLIATITHESTEALGLAVGTSVIALIKSSSILLADALPGIRLSARNQFKGEIERITQGAVNSEVTLSLPGGLTIAAIITEESREALHLAIGQPAIALFKASSVILGVFD